MVEAQRIADRNLVERAFSLQGPDTIEQFFELWADDAVFDTPFARPWKPSKIEGKPAVIAAVGAFMKRWKSSRFIISRLCCTDEEGVILAEADGEVVLDNGTDYNNKYICLIVVRDGRIRLWREYFNPLVLNDAKL